MKFWLKKLLIILIISNFKKYSCEEYIKNSLEILKVLGIDIFKQYLMNKI